MLRFLRDHGLLQQGFNLLLDAIRQLAAGGIEELDAIVLVRVVGGADDHAKTAVQTLRHVGDARRRQRPNQHHIDTGRDKTRLQRRFKHVSGDARVLADEHAAATGCQHARRGTGQAQGKIHGHRRRADPTTNPVGTEIVAHVADPCSTALTVRTASTVGLTSWVRTMRAPLATARAANPKPPYSRSCTLFPKILPMTLLRETPTSSGAPSAAKRGSSLNSVKLCSKFLPNPKPGSSAMASLATPASMHSRRSSAKNAITSATTSL